jgi:hypothetical protein
VTGEGVNGFSGIPLGPPGDISFKIAFSVSPSGDVTVDNVTGRTFPSLEIYSYQNGKAQLLLSFTENDEADLTRPRQQIYPAGPTTLCLELKDEGGQRSQYCSVR